MNEYDEYIEQFKKEGKLAELNQLKDLVVAEQQGGWKELSERIAEVVASIEATQNTVGEVSSYQRQEIESLGGNQEELEKIIAEIHAESSDIVGEGLQNIEELRVIILEKEQAKEESVFEGGNQEESFEDFEKKNILRELENVEWALERFSNENVETLMSAVGKDSLVTSYNSDYVKVVSGSMYNEIMHELDISRSHVYNKRIDFASQSPEKKEELRNIALEVGDRLHKIARRRGLPSLGLGNGSVTLNPEDDGSVSLLLSLGAGNSYRGIGEGEKKTVRDFKAEVLFNLQKKKEELEDAISQ